MAAAEGVPSAASGQWEFWGLFASGDFQECSTVAAASSGNQACCLEPSVTHGAAGALGPAYTGAPVSLVFQG
jgi:hypothetical protein